MSRSSPILVVLCLCLPSVAAEELTARQILDKVDDLYRGESSQGTMVMKVVTEHWTREMRLRFWSKGKDMTLIRILSPHKEKGTATLKNGNKIWNYLPKIKRTIKVPSSMMGGAWMGSHFTNDDLVKESRMADDYDFEITFRGERGGQDVVEITCTPRQDAAVVWGKVVVEVRRKDYLPLVQRYYDEDMKLARSMTFSGEKLFGERSLPSVMKLVPEDKPGESTEVRYEDVEFDVGLPDSKFSLRSLQE
ncbi:MAG: outer membrane lipoprotein-sorting protein [Deltaproteobacteria bacterium]|nr:outer membrane lipoprotein-sorting protein [Deltaproteobacteria bacterium]